MGHVTCSFLQGDISTCPREISYSLDLSVLFTNLSSIAPSTMLDTTDKHLLARTQLLSGTAKPALTPEFLRLLRCLTSPRSFEDQGRLSTNPSSNRVGRSNRSTTSRAARRECFASRPSLLAAEDPRSTLPGRPRRSRMPRHRAAPRNNTAWARILPSTGSVAASCSTT